MGFELPLKTEDNDVVKSIKGFLDIFYNQLPPIPSLGHESEGIHYAYPSDFPINVYKLSQNLISIIDKSTSDNFDQIFPNFVKAVHESKVFAYLKNVPYQVNTIPEGISFYRVRPLHKKECNEQVEKIEERKNLFHIPFNMLERIKYLRYSLKREPALYLSSSVQLALLETRLPNYGYAVARFETKEPIDVFNVDYSYYLSHRFEEVMQEQTDVFLFLGPILPMVAACAIKVPPERENNDFKEEYIIPQLLMKYVQAYRSEYQAIRFYSSRINLADPEQHKNQYNLVLPTKVTSTSGYDDKLKTLFSMTEVLNVPNPRDPLDIQHELRQKKAYEIDF